MDSLKGSVERVVYRKEESGYTVMELRVSGNLKVTCVGIFPSLNLGESLLVRGDYVNHPVYGKQFSATSYEEQLPEDRDSIERYLGSGAIKGLGAILAARITRRFGDDTLRIIEEEPEKLSEVKGISKAKAREIQEQVLEKSALRQAMMFLTRYGISITMAKRIYDTYGSNTYHILQENPYRLAEDIQGIGFVTADEIASRIGIHIDSDYRIRSGLLYILSLAGGEGHVYLPREELFSRAEEILGVSKSYMEKHLMDLAMEKKVYLYSAGEDSLVYSYQFFRMEKNVALMLCSLNGRLKVDEEKARARIARVEEEDGISLDEHQREAIMAAASHGLTVLTGGPGTGKTTTIQSLIHFFDEEELSVSLAAPTGRAAKRMGEATGREAQTIHRLLEFLPPDDEEISSGGKITFRRNASNPLECEVLIIDEMSMVDITLMHSLLLAIAPGTRVVLVGDENQLPSVGPGNVLKDIIASGVVPVVELTRIFRQAGESDIVVNAHKIMKGEQVVADNKSKDFFLLRRYDAEKIVAVTLALVGQKLPPYVGGTFRDVQVLTPMRKGLLGVEGLNGALQAYLNPPSEEKREMEVGDHIFREGDRVMQTKNNYQMKWVVKGKKGIDVDEGVGVFNGDMGILKEIDEAEGFAKVEFEDGRLAEYEIKMLEDLDLSYAITIHKSQGSEYPAVVMPLLAGPAPLMNRNLLYTAVTRAKKCVTIVGSEQTFAQMIRNERQMKRYSSLDAQIRMFYEQD